MNKETQTSIAVTEKTEDKSVMFYVPFGAQDKIKLSISIIRRLVAVPTATGKTPSDDECIKFQMMCQAKRLNPFEGDCFLIGYDTKNGPKFSQITAHQVFLKRAEASEGFAGMQSGVILKRGDKEVFEDEGDFMLDGDVLLGGWAKVYKKGLEYPIYKRIKLSTFNKAQNQWVTNPAGMIVKCAEADALRTSFPSLLGSLYVREEISEVSDMSRIAEPIFKNIESAPAKMIEVKPIAPLEQPLDALCEAAKVEPNDLLELLKVSGLAEDAYQSLDQLTPKETADVIDKWQAILPNLIASTPNKS